MKVQSNDKRGKADIITTIAVISVAPYLTDKAEHTALYKVNKNVDIKTPKRIILCSKYCIPCTSYPPTHPPSPTLHTHRREDKLGGGRDLKSLFVVLFEWVIFFNAVLKTWYDLM